MNNILFTHSYFLRFDPKQWGIGLPYAPLGTIYAAALMRQQGYNVSLFDTMFVTDPDEVIPAIELNKPNFFVIYDDGFNYLTKMCLTNMREAAFKMAKLAKERGCTVIISSSDSTDRYAAYLAEGADFVILGEAEQTLLELTQYIRDGNTDHFAIKGLAYMNGSEIIKTPNRTVMKDLDSLPMPAWDLVNMDTYRGMWLKNAGYFSVNVVTTRGCPFKCNWCAKPIYGNRYNSHSPQYIVDEIKMLKERYGMDHIWFCDDIFGLKPGWVQEFAKLLGQEGIRIRFKIQSRADLLVEEEAVSALAAAGCENVWIGAESGSQKVLDAMDKGITIDQIHTATHLMKAHGIKPSFFIQFGYPEETRDDITLTIDMINQLLPFEIGISVSYPLPGTGFYERVKTELRKKTNWTDSDEMALMFKNTYPAYYYKQLHKYVHRNYHKHLAKNSLQKLLKDPFGSSANSIKKALSVFYYGPLTYLEKLKLEKFEKSDMTGAATNINEQLAEAAFSNQSVVFDELYSDDTIISYKRRRVRNHILQYVKAGGSILELNSGTGEDALFFAQAGFKVHATDISKGMQQQLQEKVLKRGVQHLVSNEICSYTQLEQLNNKGPYDLIFSNFAGLNCTGELDKVLSSFAELLTPGGMVTLVVLPGFCLWETLLVFKGKFKTAFRRFFSSKGRRAHVEGVYFDCFYYNPLYIKKRLKRDFDVLGIEGLCTVVPPSYIEGFAEKHPRAYKILTGWEDKLKTTWPFKYIGDYYIISLRKR